MGKHHKQSWQSKIYEAAAIQNRLILEDSDPDYAAIAPEITYDVDNFGYLTVFYGQQTLGTYHDKNYGILTPEQLQKEVDSIVEQELGDDY